MVEIIKSLDKIISMIDKYPSSPYLEDEEKEEIKSLDTKWNINLIQKFLLKKILNVNELDKSVRYKNDTNIAYLTMFRILMHDENFNNDICDLIEKDDKKKVNPFWKSFMNYLINVFLFSNFEFYIHRRNFYNGKINDNVVKSIIESLLFLNQACSYNNSFKKFLFDYKVGKNSLNDFLRDENLDKEENSPHSFIDIIFYICFTCLEQFSLKFYDNNLFKIYGYCFELIDKLYRKKDSSDLNYFTLFDENFTQQLTEQMKTLSGTIDAPKLTEKIYFIDLLINCRLSLENKDLNSNYIVGCALNNFKLINKLLNMNFEDKSFIVALELIFPPSLIIQWMKQIFKKLLIEYNIVDLKDSKMELKEDFDKFHSFYSKNEKLYKNILFKLSCEFFIYINIMKDKFYNKESIFLIKTSCHKIKIIDKLSFYRSLISENASISKKFKTLKNIDYETFKTQKDDFTKNLLSTYFKIVKSCEVFIPRYKKKNEVNESNNTSEEDDLDLYPERIYFVLDPVLFNINKKKIFQRIFEMGTEDITTRSGLLIEYLDEYQEEIKLLYSWENYREIYKNILGINYDMVNLVNLGITTFLIIILLLFIDITNKDSSKIFTLVISLEIFEIILNVTFVILFFLKYMIIKELDEKKLRIINKYEYDKIEHFIKNFVFHEDICFLIFNALIGLVIIYNVNLVALICLQSFVIVKFIKTIKEIFTAVAMTIDQIVAMIFFLAIIIFIYANFSFVFIKSDYIMEVDGGTEENVCDNIFHCLIFHFDVGVRSGGGIGDSLPLTSIKNLYDFSLRYVGDFSFYIIVTLLILNMINGIIITTFSQIREENDKRTEELEDKCYICGKTKVEFEEAKLSFDHHVNEEHNYYTYLRFLLQIKGQKILSDDEEYIRECILTEDLEFLPTERSMSLDEIKNSKI